MQALLRRDMLLLWRNPGDSLIPLAFFMLISIMFPLAIGPAPTDLHAAAPGIVWSAALLSSLLTHDMLFRRDDEDGALEQLLASGQPTALLVAAKTTAHWLAFGAPITLISPLLGLWLSMSSGEIMRMLVALPLGTGIFSFFAVFIAALLVGRRHAHFLGALLSLPLCAPVVIFGAAYINGQTAPLFLLAALFALAASILPIAAALSLRAATA